MRNKKAFTLVELLAVIVILAVILVIALPQVLDVIDTTKVGSLESSAKIIADAAEKKYAEYLALGKDISSINCNEITKLNSEDYGTCTISFDSNGKATVSIKGKDDGKFDGLKCEGTKDNMICGDIPPLPVINCSFTPVKEDIIEENIRIYTVKDYDACMTYLKSTIFEEELTDEILNLADSVCKGNGIPEYGDSTSEIFKNMISGSTEVEQELIDLNVINVSFVKYTIKDYDACMTNLENVVINEWGMTNEDLDGICKGTGDGYGGSTSENIEWIIEENYYTEQELIDLNVINVEKIINPELRNGTEYVNGQYTYRYGQKYVEYDWDTIGNDGWGVTLTDKESTNPVTSEVCTYINGQPVVSMSYMFYQSKASEINLTKFNTSNIINMSGMFADSAATNLDLSNFDTSNVTNMTSMFSESSATSLDLSSFDTSNVTSVKYMFCFAACTDTVDVSHFDLSKASDKDNIFACPPPE